jgi:hypothetical protein
VCVCVCVQFQEIITRYTKVGEVVVDSMAGCLTTGMAALRLNRPCILVERQKGAMVDLAWKRLQQCYRFLKDFQLLPSPGDPPAPPQAFELTGKTWLHEAQYWLRMVRNEHRSCTSGW